MDNKFTTLIFILGAILLLVSSVLVMEHVSWGKYTFAIGAALYIMNRMRQNYAGDDFRLKRMNRFNLINAVLLVAISYLQFHGNNAWVVLLLVVALLEMYTSFRTAAYEKALAEELAAGKEKQEASNQEPEFSKDE